MAWVIEFELTFESEFDGFKASVQDAIFKRLILLEKEGPQLGRPYADTLVGSKHTNMKELRCDAANGVWRIAYAFDPDRKAILLVAGDKAGVSEKRFYKKLIKKADDRFEDHLVSRKDK
ncbi:MAG: type II toxin-antitoxin system RelE/ParE family toxin [Pseudomonadota bacterium]